MQANLQHFATQLRPARTHCASPKPSCASSRHNDFENEDEEEDEECHFIDNCLMWFLHILKKLG